MRPIPPQAVDLVAKWEGFEPVAYLDPIGVATIGYGTIKGVTKADVGVKKITKATAKEYLKRDMEEAARDLVVRIGSIVGELTDNQYSALLSFAYNLGAKNGKWTIWKRLNARQFDQVPGEMMKFVNAGGRKLQGLVNRRADEVKLWSKDEPGSSTEHVPSSVTRATATPPTPADPVAPHKSGTLIAGAVSACGAVSVAAKEITETISPWAALSPFVEQGVTIVAAVAAGAAVMALAMNWMKKREARG